MTARMWQVHIAKVKPHNIIDIIDCSVLNVTTQELQLRLNLSQ